MMNPLEHEMQRRANPVAGRHTILLFFLLLVMLSVCCAPGCAAADEIAPGTTTFGISNHTGIIWRSAQIDGDRIVWAERTPGMPLQFHNRY
jgi:hypothetical protein